MPLNQNFNSRRSDVRSRRGMVATSQPLAAQAGLRILMAGGNAADAAVATAAVLNVVEPISTGIGGDCFALFYDAATRQVTALNGSGRTSRHANPRELVAAGYATMPSFTGHASGRPYRRGRMGDLLARHGTMALADVLAPASNTLPMATLSPNGCPGLAAPGIALLRIRIGNPGPVVGTASPAAMNF